MIVFTHGDCFKKFNGIDHPERKERLDSIINSLKSTPELEINFKEAPLAKMNEIILVHPEAHIEKIFSNIPKEGLVSVEQETYADTMLCPNSRNAILRSCGAGIAAADELMLHNERIFCATRPPGHHAETIRANGFCFINNIAVAARYLKKSIKSKKLQLLILMYITVMELKKYSIMINQ